MYRRTVKDSQLPYTPAAFAALAQEERARVLAKLSPMRKALIRGFRSIAEMQFSDRLTSIGLVFKYEDQAQKKQYEVPAKKKWYLCDFFIPKRDGTTMFVDFKGEWDAQDREKFLLLKQQYPDMDLRIVFHGDPYRTFITKTRTTSYADICTAGKGTGKWKELSIPFAHKDMPQEWLAECLTGGKKCTKAV